MKAKRLLSLVLATMLLASLSVTAFAEADAAETKDSSITQASDTKSASTTVITPEVGVVYTVKIPAKIQLSENDSKALAGDGTISISGARLQTGGSVTVTYAKSGNLTNADNATLAFTSTGSGTTNAVAGVSGDNNVITFSSSTGTAFDGSATASYAVTSTLWAAAFAGTYSSSETFTIAYVAPKSAA